MTPDLLLSAVVGALAACLAAPFLLGQHRSAAAGTPAEDGDDPFCLLRDGALRDLAPGAAAVLGDRADSVRDWSDLRAIFAPLVGNLPVEPPRVRPLDLPFRDLPDTLLRIVPRGRALRVGLAGDRPDRALTLLTHLQQAELTQLRDASAATPCPMWLTAADGTLLWANPRFRALANAAGRTGIFDLPPLGAAAQAQSRERLIGPGDTGWYEVSRVRTEGGVHHVAVNIDAVIEAETAQRNFVQTLAKTFAHLPTGLAIFDRNRQLVLFNPSLIDLTRLPAEFLSARPTLMAFFDRLRETRMMPEPKSYAGWREQMAEMVAAAREDRYAEEWSLPNGLTYRITGRPHPDGAIALLLEDISAEITLTRRFRTELELSQGVLDRMEEALVVFNQSGLLTFCNAAYRRLWKTDPDSAFADVTVVDAARLWQGGAAPAPLWGEIRDFVLSYGERTSWDGETAGENGARLSARIDPLPGGSTLVRFSQEPAPIRLPHGPICAMLDADR
ncbi:PAS-domain containing protein [Litorisediminicola beolgyonensis]|uniref:PAS-domain containing protein n=1 Tax=Litorisediminicola beolgyonensis TaxID=1173614 RepID=A0ABW3ZLZ1_9RHOB